jgi:hypothetical protein
VTRLPDCEELRGTRLVPVLTQSASEVVPTTTTTALVVCCCLLLTPNRGKDLDVLGFSASAADLRFLRSAARTGSRPRLLEVASATGERLGDEFISDVERLGDAVLTARSRDGDEILLLKENAVEFLKLRAPDSASGDGGSSLRR